MDRMRGHLGQRAERWRTIVVLSVTALVSATVLGLTGAPVGASSPAVSHARTTSSTWSLVPSLNPSTSSNDFSDVSCVSAAFCMAVGAYDGTEPSNPMIQRWNGTTWSLEALPTGSSYATLQGISCVTAAFCLAVGYAGPPFAASGVVLVWNGQVWSTMTTAAIPGGSTSSFSKVSCSSITFCAVVGALTSSSVTNLIEIYNGALWSITPSPTGSGLDQLLDISCTGPTFCMALGDDTQSYTELWNGHTWARQAIPQAPAPESTEFLGLSCSSPTFCLTVGQAYTHSSSASLVDAWNGSAWAAAAVPPNAAGTDGNFLYGVDCEGPGLCVGVGSTYTDFAADETGPLVASWDGSGWTVGSAPTTVPSDPDDRLLGVSCVWTAACTAVGEADGSHTLVVSAPIVHTGYYEVASDGGIFAFGTPFYGSTGSLTLNQPIVGIAVTFDADGYWEVASDGGILAFGDAAFHGSMGGQPLVKPIVGIAATPDGGGYWEVAPDGGIFAFGDATFQGSMGGKPLNHPIVSIATTPDGKGYWEVASDGGIFAFGDAAFHGSMGGQPLNQPIVGIGAGPTGGYYEVASDGGLFAFGGVPFAGSMGGRPLNKPIVGMDVVGSGSYYEVASDGGLFAFGGAPFLGSTGGSVLNKPVVGMAG